jgi:hypothetical protein
MDVSKLLAMEKKDLLRLAAEHGLQVHFNSKNETIAQAIIDSIQKKPNKGDVVEKQEVKEAIACTKEEIETAIKSIKETRPDFKAIYTDSTWWFSFKGAEDSGNLSIPLRVIVDKARIVAQGARLLRAQKDFGDINVHPNSAYTNRVLA